MNVTITFKLVPELDELNTTTNLVAVCSKHKEAAMLPTITAQLPPCAEVINLLPKIVMELERYPAEGTNDEKAGVSRTVNAEKLVATPIDVGLLIFNIIPAMPAAVPVLRATTICVLEVMLHIEAPVPEDTESRIFALHD